MSLTTAQKRQAQVWPVYSVSEAARLLPWSEAAARQWLRDRDLVIQFPPLSSGRKMAPVVSWWMVHQEFKKAGLANVDPSTVPEPPEKTEPTPVRREGRVSLP